MELKTEENKANLESLFTSNLETTKTCFICVKLLGTEKVELCQEICHFEDFCLTIELQKIFIEVTGIETCANHLICTKCFYRLRDAYLLRLEAQRSFSRFTEIKEEIDDDRIEDEPFHEDEIVVPDAPEIPPSLKKKRRKKALKKRPEPKKRKAKTIKLPKQLVCDLCGEIFERKLDITKHMKKFHISETPLMCTHPGCKELFKKLQTLQNHLYSVHNVARPFMCELCGVSFANRCKLQLHNRRHTDERPYKCAVAGCGSAFKQPNDLKTHTMCIHSDERPYSCEFCGLSFKIRNSLRAHRRRMHTQHMMRTCPECDRVFMSPAELNEHIAIIHRGERRFECTLCTKNYSRAFHLRRHYSDSHKAAYEKMLENGAFRKTRRNIENPYYEQTNRTVKRAEAGEDNDLKDVKKYEEVGN